MSWDPAAIGKMAGGVRAPLFRLVFYEAGVAARAGVGSGAELSSHTVHGQRAHITDGGVRVSSASVQVSGWTHSAGAWSVECGGDLAAEVGAVRRGQIGALFVGFEGDAPDQYSRIAVGVLQQIRGIHPRLTFEFWDLIAALRGRQTTDYSEAILFKDAGATTTLTSGYTVGDSVLNLTSATKFEWEAGASGVVKMADFYLTYTGQSGNQLTGVSATGQFGTTASNQSGGATATAIVHLEGNPADIFARIVTSTGDVALPNGYWDDYPKTWGLGVSHTLLAESDLVEWRDTVLIKDGGGIESWNLLVDAPQTNGLGWLTSLLSIGGIWPVIKQGQLSIRAAQTEPARLESGVEIVEADIIAIDGWQAWAGDQPAEAGTCRVKSATGQTDHTESTLQTLPALEVIEHDLSTVIYSDEADQRQGILDRLKGWDLRIAEALDLRCAGWRMAQLVAGDVVQITTNRAFSRREYVGGRYTKADALVVQVAADWLRGETRLRILVYDRSAGGG